MLKEMHYYVPCHTWKNTYGFEGYTNKCAKLLKLADVRPKQGWCDERRNIHAVQVPYIPPASLFTVCCIQCYSKNKNPTPTTGKNPLVSERRETHSLTFLQKSTQICFPKLTRLLSTCFGEDKERNHR